MIGLAWEWHHFLEKEQKQNSNLPLFLLLHKDSNATTHLVTKSLHRNLALLPRPLDVWVVNFSASEQLETQGCAATLLLKF